MIQSRTTHDIVYAVLVGNRTYRRCNTLREAKEIKDRLSGTVKGLRIEVEWSDDK